MEQQPLIDLKPTPPKQRRPEDSPQWIRAEPPEAFTPAVLVQISRRKYVLASFLTHERRFSQKARTYVEVVIFTRRTPQMSFRDILAEVAQRRRDAVPTTD